MGSGASTSTITVLIADEHPLIAAGLSALTGAIPGLSVCGQASDASQAVALYQQWRPHVVLMDLGVDRLATMARLRCFDPDARIVILSSHEGAENVYRGLRAGALAYLFKQAACTQLGDCIRSVAAGESYLPDEVAATLAGRKHVDCLSPRELDILIHLSSGKSNKLIARSAGIEVGTVKFHVNNILAKLQVSSRTEAAIVAAQRGLLSLN